MEREKGRGYLLKGLRQISSHLPEVSVSGKWPLLKFCTRLNKMEIVKICLFEVFRFYQLTLHVLNKLGSFLCKTVYLVLVAPCYAMSKTGWWCHTEHTSIYRLFGAKISLLSFWIVKKISVIACYLTKSIILLINSIDNWVWWLHVPTPPLLSVSLFHNSWEGVPECPH